MVLRHGPWNNPASAGFCIVAPQCSHKTTWSNLSVALVSLLHHIQRTFPVDPQRCYVTGLSMGGFGAWSRPSSLDVFDPFSQSVFNSNALTNIGANLADAAVTRFTGNNFLGDVAGNVAGNLLDRLF